MAHRANTAAPTSRSAVTSRGTQARQPVSEPSSLTCKLRTALLTWKGTGRSPGGAELKHTVSHLTHQLLHKPQPSSPPGHSSSGTHTHARAHTCARTPGPGSARRPPTDGKKAAALYFLATFPTPPEDKPFSRHLLKHAVLPEPASGATSPRPSGHFPKSQSRLSLVQNPTLVLPPHSGCTVSAAPSPRFQPQSGASLYSSAAPLHPPVCAQNWTSALRQPRPQGTRSQPGVRGCWLGQTGSAARGQEGEGACPAAVGS